MAQDAHDEGVRRQARRTPLCRKAVGASPLATGFVDGSLMGGSSNPTADFIRKNGKSPGIDAHIDVLDITPTTAIVRVITGNDASGADCNEYLTLVKDDNGWAVIAKVFHQFDL